MTLLSETPPTVDTLAQFDLRLIDLLPVAAYMCAAPSGQIIRFNKKAAELWGRTPRLGEDAERTCGSYRVYRTDGTQIPFHEIPMANVLRDGVAIRDAEVILERPDSSRLYVVVNIDPIFNHSGDVIGAINVFIDISERKLAERQSQQLLDIMHAEHERLIRFFEHSSAFMAVLHGPQHIYEKANERYLTMIGRRDILGRRVMDVLPELEGQGFFTRLDEVYHSGRSFIGKEVRLLLHSETGELQEKILDVVYEPLVSADGKVGRILVHGLDLTERKHMELELQRRAEELASLDRQKDEFIALLAHELRNPLAPIRNGLQIMAMAEAKPEVLTPVRDMMDRQLNHMVRLIDDLLDVSRMNRNKLFLQKTRVSLAEAMNHALEATRPALEAARHELILQLPPADLQLDADLTRLAQVFGNLLSNSIKYTEPGGRIWFTAEVKPDEVTVSVRDSGIGIPQEALSNIFDMFSQVHSPERTSTGLGIGLALVRNLVEMHGGRVTVESEGSGRGSCFLVHLPLEVASAQSPPEVVTPVARAAAQQVKILVVDDNRDACTSLAMLLEIMGHVVRTAYDGQMAIQYAEEFRPQLILMDIGMPVLDGYQATRRLRSFPWAQDVQIVALTGWGQDHDRHRSQSAGCSGHLVKPVSRPDLENLLQNLVSA
mgnify:CR=1 FL=1|jgi:Signal transduction histidine kinase